MQVGYWFISMETAEKLIVFNIGWMNKYQGLSSDEIHSTAEFVEQYNFAYEMFNFRPVDGYMYGFVQPSGKKPFNERTIRIERLLPTNHKYEFVKGVLVVWVAPNPKGGTYLIGWYRNATVYRHYQESFIASRKLPDNEIAGYFTKAKEENCTLLPVEKRIFPIPRTNKVNTKKYGVMGQSCVWFADGDKNLSFRNELLSFIKNYEQQQIGEDNSNFLPEEITHPNVFYEGALRTISVNVYERNPKARKECLEEYGTRCGVCDFDFFEKYGEVGADFIHVHHLKPLAEIGKEYKINPVLDLLPVCPNCHAIIHKRNPPYSIDEVKGFIRRASR